MSNEQKEAVKAARLFISGENRAFFQAVHMAPTLRDHFAMAALSGYMSTDSHHFDDSAEWAARHAYEVADAMLKERER